MLEEATQDVERWGGSFDIVTGFQGVCILVLGL